MDSQAKCRYWLKLVRRHGAESCIRELLDIIEQQKAMLDVARDLLPAGLDRGARPAYRKAKGNMGRNPTGRRCS